LARCCFARRVARRKARSDRVEKSVATNIVFSWQSPLGVGSGASDKNVDWNGLKQRLGDSTQRHPAMPTLLGDPVVAGGFLGESVPVLTV
jgi:hypothetical protein